MSETPASPREAASYSPFLFIEVVRTERAVNGEIYDHCLAAGFHGGVGESCREDESPWVTGDERSARHPFVEDLVEWEDPPPGLLSLDDLREDDRQ